MSANRLAKGTCGMPVTIQATNRPVVDLLRRRWASKSVPGNRSDGAKLGLVIEGGGMRGVVSAGMATALHYLGLRDCFDAVYGASAGALIGSFFVANQMPLGPTVYEADLSNGRFLSLLNPLRGQSILNLDFLLTDILQGKRPLDVAACIHSSIPLYIVVSSIRKRCSESFRVPERAPELFTLLRASATMPLVAGGPVAYNDDLYFDASLYESIPIRTALDDGCTHALVLMTRVRGQERPTPGFFDRRFVAPALERRFPGLGYDYLGRPERYRASLSSIEESKAADIPPHVLPVQLICQARAVSKFERRRSRLRSGAIAGMLAAFRSLGLAHPLTVDSVLYPFTSYGAVPTLGAL